MEAAERPRASELLESVIDWMRARMVEGKSRRKILEHEAKTHFGDMLTDRIFDAAYKVVFNRSRGRPRARCASRPRLRGDPLRPGRTICARSGHSFSSGSTKAVGGTLARAAFMNSPQMRAG